MDVRYAVRRWYSAPAIVDGRSIVTTSVDEIDYPDEAAAREAYARVLRRRSAWVPEGAVDSGVEAIGFRPEPAGAVVGPRGAVERLRAAGRHEEADALQRCLDRRNVDEGAA